MSSKSERSGSTRFVDFPRSSLSRVSFSAIRRRRSDTADETPVPNKSVLVTLRLSSTSFLDSAVQDALSSSPLYVIRTTGTSTSVLRTNARDDSLVKTAEIKWPKVIPTKGKTRETLGILVQMSGGRWQSADTVLKPGTMLSAPPKFNVPNFPHTMKWKRMGSAYWCTTSSVKGPIATFHPAVEGVPPRINVFETLHDKYDSRSMMVHNGVSLLLMDHLIVTAMLLVTDVQDWMLVQKYEGSSSDSAPSLPPLSASSSDLFDMPPQSAPASASQWRKILYGEPLFPKRYPNSRTVSTTDLSASAPLPTSAKQMAKIVYGDPIYPSLASSPVTSLWDSDDEGADADDAAEDRDLTAWRAQQGASASTSSLPSRQLPPTRGPNPSAESVLNPSHPGAGVRPSPPGHTYMDPGFYAVGAPPVPQIPAQYASSYFSAASSIRGATPPDSASARSMRAHRELPTPPSPLSLQPAHRSQSTPPREVPAPYGRRPSEPLFLSTAASSSASTSTSPSATSSSMPSAPPAAPPLLTRSQSMKMRQLPTPPTPTTEASYDLPDGPRPRTRSGSRRASVYSQRSLPTPPGAPPLPRPPRKDLPPELWMYSWSGAAAGMGEAPPPYLALGSPGLPPESPTSTRSMGALQSNAPSPYPPSPSPSLYTIAAASPTSYLQSTYSHHQP